MPFSRASGASYDVLVLLRSKTLVLGFYEVLNHRMLKRARTPRTQGPSSASQGPCTDMYRSEVTRTCVIASDSAASVGYP